MHKSVVLHIKSFHNDAMIMVLAGHACITDWSKKHFSVTYNFHVAVALHFLMIDNFSLDEKQVKLTSKD